MDGSFVRELAKGIEKAIGLLFVFGICIGICLTLLAYGGYYLVKNYKVNFEKRQPQITNVQTNK